MLDHVADFHETVARLRAKPKPFAIATVIKVDGSASARAGSKAIFDFEGRNLQGWVGGGCAERFIGEQVLEAIKENKTRIVIADMDDEIFGLGVACGGRMHVFIDPILPPEDVPLPKARGLEKDLKHLAVAYGWNVVTDESLESPRSFPELLTTMSRSVAQKRGTNGLPMRSKAKTPARPAEMNGHVAIVGRSRITEALARHFVLLGLEVRVVAPSLEVTDYPRNVKCHCLDSSYGEIEFRKGDVVIVASHTAQDPAIVEQALKAGAAHVAMVGSAKRAREVMTHLRWSEEKMLSEPLYVPAGLDIGARHPEEIALSIVAEVLHEKGIPS